MRNYIIISKKQADKVRGRHGKYSALEPVEFPDGRYGIPARCIDDPEFADIKKTLEEYQRGEVQEIVDLQKKIEEFHLEQGTYVYKDKVITVEKPLTIRAEDINEKESRARIVSIDTFQKEGGNEKELIKIEEHEQETDIEAGRYYLSQDYWVVLSKVTERVSFASVDKLSELSDKFEIRKDIRTEVDKMIDERIAREQAEKEKESEKEPEKEIEEPVKEPEIIPEPEKPEEPVKPVEPEPEVKPRFMVRLWNKIKSIFK